MLSRQILSEERVGSRSVFSMAGRSLKVAWTKLRCPGCHGRGVRTCSKCKGKGILLGEGLDSRGALVVFMEPCRRCIGKGKEECQACASIESSYPIAATENGRQGSGRGQQGEIALNG